MPNTTIIYYTSNREKEAFEKKVILRLSANLPIISVSQKPLDLGHNICVGDIGVNPENAFNQMLIGCMMAKTPFVTFAEADTLYPPEYFAYEPKELKRYWFEDVYILHPRSRNISDGYFLKGRSDCAHMSGRELAIKLLQEGNGKGMKPKGEHRPTLVKLDTPIVNIKTGDGMRPKTQTSRIPVATLPYWGSAKELSEVLND